jgi:4a-hydroxytetrahydrobiopterin dehydratase
MPLLRDRHCQPIAPGTKPLASAALPALLAQLESWRPDPTGTAITRTFELEDFPTAIRLVNRVAALAEDENHHPDVDIRWNKVTLTLSSHDVGGLSENDFILAAQIDALD